MCSSDLSGRDRVEIAVATRDGAQATRVLRIADLSGSDWEGPFMQKLGMQEGEAIEHPWVTKAIENAQRKVEGRNFDIISGITAPLIYYYGFVKKRLNKNILIAWNLLCLALLLNIVINAVLSAPFPFQQFAFNQPNIAVFYFPYVWLPGCIVPLVLLSHLVAIKQLMSKK